MHWIHHADAGGANEHGSVVQIRHKLGVEFPVVARTLVLRDALSMRVGAGVLFHPVEKIDALPLGEGQETRNSRNSPLELENRLARLHEDFSHGDGPFGVLWMTVDQGPRLRRSHGARACEAMLESMEKTLASGLKPAEEIGRWGDQDFLILSHERSAVALAAHAQWLAGLARTADFRWWGDRISLTVSVGAAQAEEGESLCTLLDHAEAALLASIHAGGNHTTAARGNS
jgi:GGDEF domain-containing protein